MPLVHSDGVLPEEYWPGYPQRCSPEDPSEPAGEMCMLCCHQIYGVSYLTTLGQVAHFGCAVKERLAVSEAQWLAAERRHLRRQRAEDHRRR